MKLFAFRITGEEKDKLFELAREDGRSMANWLSTQIAREHRARFGDKAPAPAAPYDRKMPRKRRQAHEN